MASFVLGLDLGQVHDYTALAVLERPAPADNGGESQTVVYALRHLKRYALGTPYTDIVPAVMQQARSVPLGGSPLVVDQTGVGRALVDMLRRAGGAGRIIPVTITAGQSVTRTEEGSYHVPKKELVTCLQLLLQQRRLKMPRDLPHVQTLVQELHSFQVKITLSAHETFRAWREGVHDDLVLALALACWWAERNPPWTAASFSAGGESLIDQAPQGVFLE